MLVLGILFNPGACKPDFRTDNYCPERIDFAFFKTRNILIVFFLPFFYLCFEFVKNFRLISTIIVSVLVLLFSSEVKAQETIFFRINNSDIDSGFKQNASVLNSIETTLSSRTPSRVRIHAAASPDGPTALNTRLSRERAQVAVDLIKKLCPNLPDSTFVVTTTAEDIDGTLLYIGKSGKDWADEATKILSREVSNPEEGLRHIHNGQVWRYLADEVFPLLRKTDIEFTFESDAVVPVVSGDDSATEVPVEQISAPSGDKKSQLPWWSIALLGLLGAGTLGFGAMYLNEHRKNRRTSVPYKPVGPAISSTATPPVRPAVSPSASSASTAAAAAAAAAAVAASAVAASTPEPEPEPEPDPVMPEPEPEPEIVPVVEPVAEPVVEETVLETPVEVPVAPIPVVEEAPAVAEEPSQFATRVYDLIVKNIDNADFGVEQLAAAMGMSRIHLNRKLKAESIASPSSLLKEARMQLASRLIRENTHSMADISSRCGFATPSYFSTAFKDYYGVSPSDYK